MAQYNAVGRYSSVGFHISDINVTSQPSTLKTKMGKKYIEVNIPLRDYTDRIIQINGILTGLSRTSAQSVATAIENDRDSLTALEDGNYHTYVDGRHNANYAIVPGSLTFTDEANREPGEPMKFTMTLIEWEGH